MHALRFFLLAITVGGGSLAAAAVDPKVVVAQRQAGFKRMGSAFKTISDQLKTEAPAKDQMAAAARVIAATARPQAGLFPAGSGASAGVANDALPAIWSERAAFDAQMAKLVAESTKLVAATAGGDVAAVRAQLQATAATCKGCHRQFRADD